MTMRRAVTWAAALCALFLRHAEAGRPMIGLVDQPEADLPPNEKLDVPAYVTHFDDDTFYSQYLKKKDVVVMWVREDHCPDCDHYSKVFYDATRALAELPDVSVGQIDVNREPDIFTDYHGVLEDLPALLVFKCDDVVKAHKRPIRFVVNDRIRDDLPAFVRRMRGPVHRHIAAPSDMEQLIADGSAYADGLAFALWLPPSPSKKQKLVGRVLLERVASVERYNTVLGAVNESFWESEELRPHAVKYFGEAPTKLTLVSYETGLTPLRKAFYEVHSKDMKDPSAAVSKALAWIREEKSKRDGHKYDHVNSFMVDDIVVPENHTRDDVVKIPAAGGDKKYIKARLEGRSSKTNTRILTRDIEFVTQENQTMAGIEKGVVGMSVGMKRLMVIPEAERTGWPYGPIEMHPSTQLHLYVTILSVGDSHKMPGRIEWETDPEKIAEHKRKSAEQDRLREEAIARGEDPDAQCKKEP